MELPRIQAFEFNDHPSAPAALRESITEALSRTIDWGGMMRGLVEPLGSFLEEAGATEVLDLGAGAGGPAGALVRAFERVGAAPRFVLTDLFPQPGSWRRLERAHPGRIGWIGESVDAAAIPEALSAGRARLVLNVLHHFPSELARGVFEDATRQGAPIFVAEGFGRNPLQFLNFVPMGLVAMGAGPLLSPTRRLQKAALVWGTPLPWVASAWDGLVSTLRVYSEAELRRMVRGLPGEYQWRWGRWRYPPAGRGYYFWGVPGR